MMANALHWAMSLAPWVLCCCCFILQPPTDSQSWRFWRQENKLFVYAPLFGKRWHRALQLDCKFLGVRRPPFILVFLSTIDTPCTDVCALCRLHFHRKTSVHICVIPNDMGMASAEPGRLGSLCTWMSQAPWLMQPCYFLNSVETAHLSMATTHSTRKNSHCNSL